MNPSSRRVARFALGLALVLAGSLEAQSRVLLEGTFDGELWATDSNSNLLTRNDGRPMALGRLQLWGALEPWRRVAFYALGETGEGTGKDDYETELEMAGVRLTASPRFVLDAGKITTPIGTFAARRFSWRNPLIGEPDGYAVQYPIGVQLSGATRFVDYRIAALSLPAVHEEYTPDPTQHLRPVLAVGFTPFIGVRLGLSGTWGPYLNDRLSPALLAQRDWRSYRQRVAGAELAASAGYFELVAEAAHSSYDVPGRPDPVDGLTYYVEGKYTFTPRLYLATRVERNDYPFIQPVTSTQWVARKTDFHDEELAVGFRLSAATLLKASVRQDKWHVNDSNSAFVRPGGRAFAVQFSQRFDVIGWIDRQRLR